MTDADLVFMREALDQAAQAQAQGEVPVGAVVVCDGFRALHVLVFRSFDHAIALRVVERVRLGKPLKRCFF